MKKNPFSNAGFRALQKELYAKSDAKLLLEASAIRTDFSAWLNNNFKLHPSQLDFIGEVDQRAKRLLIEQTAFAVENRLAISLEKAEAGKADDQGKIIWPTSNLSATAGDDRYEASGELVINIAYHSI